MKKILGKIKEIGKIHLKMFKISDLDKFLRGWMWIRRYCADLNLGEPNKIRIQSDQAIQHF